MRLVLLNVEGNETEFPIEEGSNLVGRWDPDQTAYPEIDLEELDTEAKISRKHAIIERQGSKAYIEDLGSLNGTYLNRTTKLEPSSRYPLKSGDEIMLGKILFRFEE